MFLDCDKLPEQVGSLTAAFAMIYFKSGSEVLPSNPGTLGTIENYSDRLLSVKLKTKCLGLFKIPPHSPA